MKTTVRQLLDKKGHKIFCIAPDKPVLDAIKLMSVQGIGALLVMRDEELVGIISERDYARRVILEDRSSLTTRVEEIMSKKVLYVAPETTTEDCMVLMSERFIRHLPVLEEEKVVGVVSIGDIVLSIIANKERTIEQLERYIQGY